MPNVEIYLANDTTLATAIPIDADAGSESAETELHVWYSKGTAGGAARTLRLMVAAESQATPGTLVYSGVPPLDRGWLKVRASGTVNPGSVAGLEPQSTGWFPVSSGAPFSLSSLPGNTARIVFVKLATPLDVGQANETWRLFLVPVWEDVVTPMPLGLRGIGGGILSGVGDPFVTEPIALATITPSGTPDALVHWTGLEFLVDGEESTPADGNATFDQDDSAFAALTSGESYIGALIVYADGTTEVVKGAKAATGSALPPDPATLGYLPFGLALYVEVAYGAGGSEIGAGAITNLTRESRFKVTAGTGLNVSIAPGRALLPGVFLERSDATILPVDASADTWVWIGTDGAFAKTTDTARPHVGARVLAKVTTDGAGVTAVVDLRDIVGSAFSGGGMLPGTVSVVGDVDFGGHGITNLATTTVATDGATNLAVMRQPLKRPARLVALAPVTFPNLVTNGDFTTDLAGWTGANWAQSAGTALHTAGSTDALVQDVAIIAGVTYRITVTVTGTVGTVHPNVYSDTGTPIAAGAGTVTQEILATQGGALAVAFVPSTDFDGSIDNVLFEPLYYGLPDNVGGQVVVAGDVLLLAAEVDGTKDGLFTVVDPGPWTRTPDAADAVGLYAGCEVYVREGTGGRKKYLQSAALTDLATDPQTWEVLAALP